MLELAEALSATKSRFQFHHTLAEKSQTTATANENQRLIRTVVHRAKTFCEIADPDFLLQR